MNTRTPLATHEMRSRFTRRAVLAVPLLAGLASLNGCSFAGSDENEEQTTSTLDALVAWPAKNVWPKQLLDMPEPTQQNYFDVPNNKDLLQYIPCYCGCGANGHKSVYDCYVAAERDDGSIVLDTMSFG